MLACYKFCQYVTSWHLIVSLFCLLVIFERRVSELHKMLFVKDQWVRVHFTYRICTLFSVSFFFFTRHHVFPLNIISGRVCDNCLYILNYLKFCHKWTRLHSTDPGIFSEDCCVPDRRWIVEHSKLKLVLIPHMGNRSPLSGKGYPRFIFIFIILC